MADFPDWTRLFYLTGTAITIPINIVASAVTLPVSLVASTVTIDVNLVASDITMPVSIDAATVTLDVNLTAAEVTIDINFSDQSVAVFDAAKWFAHNAQQIVISGQFSYTHDTAANIATRTVPAGKVFYIAGMGVGLDDVKACDHITADLIVGASRYVIMGSPKGNVVIFDVPVRVAAGVQVQMYVWYHSTVDQTLGGGFWGWDESV